MQSISNKQILTDEIITPTEEQVVSTLSKAPCHSLDPPVKQPPTETSTPFSSPKPFPQPNTSSTSQPSKSHYPQSMNTHLQLPYTPWTPYTHPNLYPTNLYPSKLYPTNLYPMQTLASPHQRTTPYQYCCTEYEESRKQGHRGAPRHNKRCPNHRWNKMNKKSMKKDN